MSQVVPQLRSGVEAILSHPNITLVREKGVLVDAHTVGDYTAKHIIVATGSSAKQPPIADINDPRVVTSTELLQLQKLPKKLCIIGAGVIGMEFASIFQRFGSEVQVIEFLKECLPMLDSDIAKRLRKLLEKRGIQFKMKTAVQAVADIDADIILIATGRKPNTEGLNVAAAGITTAPNGSILIDDNYRCVGCDSDIYAIGDVNGRQLLAHAAEMQALRAVNHMTGKTDGIRFDIMPAAIFTDPEAACVGLSEDQLKEQGISYECKKSFWRANGKAMAMNETEGMLKLFHAPEGRILGCHAFGAHAADIIQEVSVLMCRDTTISQLRDMVHIHPTLGEVLIANL
jgi:dihydrolipoamide dehydrogenase